MKPRTPHRILIVDDEESNLTFAERVLRDVGYEIMTAPDGDAALRLVEQQSIPFDLFIIDLVMPHMQGDELARRLREKDGDAKVLYFTGYSDRLFEQRNVLWKNEAFIEKPVTLNGLREAVSLLLIGRTSHGST